MVILFIMTIYRIAYDIYLNGQIMHYNNNYSYTSQIFSGMSKIT